VHHVYAALAEKERRLILERTRAALAAKRAPRNIAQAGQMGQQPCAQRPSAFAAIGCRSSAAFNRPARSSVQLAVTGGTCRGWPTFSPVLSNSRFA